MHGDEMNTAPRSVVPSGLGGKISALRQNEETTGRTQIFQVAVA
jgi:hypothetical protein